MKIAKALIYAGADTSRGLVLAGGLLPALDSPPHEVATELRHKAMSQLLEASKQAKGLHEDRELRRHLR